MSFVKSDLEVTVSFTGVDEMTFIVYCETILQFHNKEGLGNFQVLCHGIHFSQS
jgi:hypothetical protein